MLVHLESSGVVNRGARDDAATIIRATAACFRIRAATLATYAPERDRDEKTLHLALQLIELIGDLLRRNNRDH